MLLFDMIENEKKVKEKKCKFNKITKIFFYEIKNI